MSTLEALAIRLMSDTGDIIEMNDTEHAMPHRENYGQALPATIVESNRWDKDVDLLINSIAAILGRQLLSLAQLRIPTKSRCGVHSRNALRYGATPDQIEEVFNTRTFSARRDLASISRS
jgi:hypothetical protein